MHNYISKIILIVSLGLLTPQKVKRLPQFFRLWIETDGDQNIYC